jgi:hypothetical protein
MYGEVVSRLIPARDDDERYLTGWNRGGNGFAMTFQGGEVVRHGMEALRIAPQGLHDGMNLRWKLPHFANQPFQRSRCSRTEDSDEAARRAWRTTS